MSKPPGLKYLVAFLSVIAVWLLCIGAYYVLILLAVAQL